MNIFQKQIELMVLLIIDNDVSVGLISGIIGHIGGDDFIVIFTNENWLETCEQVLDNFKDLVPSYYKPEDISLGGIGGESRSGEKFFPPMTSLSVGLMPPHVIDSVTHNTP